MATTTCAHGTLSKLVMVRLHPGTDVIEGITDACREHGIRSGAITTCIGSLQRASFLVVKPMDNRLGGGYSDPVALPGPVELVSSQGTVGMDESGAFFIHLHGVLSDGSGRSHGGHLIAGRCPVLITCEVLISGFDGMAAVHRYDPEVEMKVLCPERSRA
ncbi:MAG: DNA-binding protein [Desulfobacterales bacterium]|jgi:hypothetical protein|nr:DNA-binding protein [Desulfobacterales bacterium]